MSMAAHLPPAPVVARAPTTASGFTGIWVMELSTDALNAVPDRLSLRNGFFARGEGSTSVRVKADGRVHLLGRDEYVDAVSVTASGRRDVRERDHLAGRLVYTVSYTVSADGRTLTRHVVDFSKPDGRPVPTVSRHRRVGPVPLNGSLVTGTWRATSVSTTRDHLTERLTVTGQRVIMSAVGGYGYAATIGGAPVPIAGDAPSGRVSVTMPDPHTIVEHMSLGGKPTMTVTKSLLPDASMIRVVARRHDGGTSTWLMRRRRPTRKGSP